MRAYALLRTTYLEAMRDMEAGLGSTCITYKLMLRYTSIHVGYIGGQDLYSMLTCINLIIGVVVVDPCRFSTFTLAAADIVLVM